MITDNEAVEIGRKPENQWTEKERSDLYWWFYHGIEEPMEDQLRYFCRRCGSREWCGFLLEKFPTMENYLLIRKLKFGSERRRSQNKASGGYFARLLRNLFMEQRPLSKEFLILVTQCGGKSMRRRAEHMLHNL